jgi:hypothetical protein
VLYIPHNLLTSSFQAAVFDFKHMDSPMLSCRDIR